MTEGVSSTAKNSASFGALKNSRLTKLIAWSKRPISWLARPMKVTISPTVARSFRCSQVPSAKVAISVTVELAPDKTVSSAHQLSTGNCAAISWSMTPRSRRVSADSLTKLWTSVTLPSASPACSASAECCASTRACAAWV